MNPDTTKPDFVAQLGAIGLKVPEEHQAAWLEGMQSRSFSMRVIKQFGYTAFVYGIGLLDAPVRITYSERNNYTPGLRGESVWLLPWTQERTVEAGLEPRHVGNINMLMTYALGEARDTGVAYHMTHNPDRTRSGAFRDLKADRPLSLTVVNDAVYKRLFPEAAVA